MEDNERAMKDASQAMIKALARFTNAYRLTDAQQIYVGIMVTGFLIAEHKGKPESCIQALRDSIGQYKTILAKTP